MRALFLCLSSDRQIRFLSRNPEVYQLPKLERGIIDLVLRGAWEFKVARKHMFRELQARSMEDRSKWADKEDVKSLEKSSEFIFEKFREVTVMRFLLGGSSHSSSKEKSKRKWSLMVYVRSDILIEEIWKEAIIKSRILPCEIVGYLTNWLRENMSSKDKNFEDELEGLLIGILKSPKINISFLDSKSWVRKSPYSARKVAIERWGGL